MICMVCGAQTVEMALCAFHPATHGADWAEGNRIWNDFFHRGIVPARLDAHEREDTFWTLVT